MSTILLVDDEPELLELYAEVLELMEHRVIRAHDGREALDIAHERHPDLVVTDCQMPRMSGVELCQRLVQDEELQDIPVIMHSSARNPHAPGVQAFLSKCCELDEFEEVVSRALEEGRPPTEHGPPPAMCPSQGTWWTSWEGGSACYV